MGEATDARLKTTEAVVTQQPWVHSAQSMAEVLKQAFKDGGGARTGTNNYLSKLAKPKVFDGDESRHGADLRSVWRDWKLVMMANSAAIHQEGPVVLERVENLATLQDVAKLVIDEVTT